MQQFQDCYNGSLLLYPLNLKPIKMKITKDYLQRYFDLCKFKKNYYLKRDEINGKTFAITEKQENGGISVKTDFMKPNEMKAYLVGRYDLIVKRY